MATDQTYVNPNANYYGTTPGASFNNATPVGVNTTNGVADYRVGNLVQTPSPVISNAVAEGNVRQSVAGLQAERERANQEIQNQALARQQAIIDAINTQFGAKAQRVQQLGEQSLASQRSINLRAGLGGSDFGAQAKGEVRAKTSQELAGVDAERTRAIQEAVTGIENLTLKQQEAARLNRQEDATYRKEIQDDASKTLDNLQKGGTTLEKLRLPENVDAYNALKNAGVSDIEIDARLKPAAIKYNWNVLADGRVMRTSEDGTHEFFNAPPNLNPSAKLDYKEGIGLVQETPKLDANGNIIGFDVELLMKPGQKEMTAYEQAKLEEDKRQFGLEYGLKAGTTPGTSKPLDQINLVKSSLEKAKTLAGASGRSGARKAAESWFIGSTDYTNLVAETNTLRTNVLTMMTDPGIKKFFGPQMSNADVQLMTSAGTTLNPELQSPENMKTELTRLSELMTRAEKAVREGLAAEGKTPGQTPSTGATSSGNSYTITP